MTRNIQWVGHDGEGNSVNGTIPVTISAPTTGGRARPTPVASYGPNGSKWPPKAPWLYETVPTVVEVDCTWAAIRAAIAAVTDAQANAGVKILIRPGNLVGLGGGSSSPTVIQGVGKATWTRNVLVVPRDGYGTVNITDATAHIKQVDGVTFALLRGTGITRTGCNNGSLAWCRLDSHRTLGLGGTNTTTGLSSGIVTQNSDLYEVVVPDAGISNVDPAGFGSGFPGPAGAADGNGWLINCKAVGCYSAPQWVPTGGAGHNDSWQLFGSSVYHGFTFVDAALFGSNNCAMQIGGWATGFDAFWGTDPSDFFTAENCLFLGPITTSQVRYPFPAGITVPTLNQAINGAGRAGRLVAHGGIFVGSIYPTQWREVIGTKVGSTPTNAKTASGAWVVDPTVANPTPAQVDSLCPVPTEARLSSIWV